MILEQIAWAVTIDDIVDPETIKKTSATRSITKLSKHIPIVGQLYGWLSIHAHWAYDGHIKAMAFDEGRLSVLFATTEFKARALALAMLLTAVAESSFALIRHDRLKLVAPNAVEAIPHPKDLGSMASELESLWPNDEDVKALCAMIHQALGSASNQN